MRKPGYKLIVFLLSIIFVAGVLVVGISSLNEYMQNTRHQFFCVDIQPGMLKDDVKSGIDKYGVYSWHDDYVLAKWSYVYFDGLVLKISLGSPVVLYFDDDNKLVGIGSRAKLGDEMQIDCNK
jgi:hypothetical protein